MYIHTYHIQIILVILFNTLTYVACGHEYHYYPRSLVSLTLWGTLPAYQRLWHKQIHAIDHWLSRYPHWQHYLQCFPVAPVDAGRHLSFDLPLCSRGKAPLVKPTQIYNINLTMLTFYDEYSIVVIVITSSRRFRPQVMQFIVRDFQLLTIKTANIRV